jgi:hypothetical protein
MLETFATLYLIAGAVGAFGHAISTLPYPAAKRIGGFLEAVGLDFIKAAKSAAG